MSKINSSLTQFSLGRKLLFITLMVTLFGLSASAFSFYFLENASLAATGASASENENAAQLPAQSCCSAVNGDVRETYTLVGSYYSLKDGQETTLMFNNKGPAPLVVTPVFYSLSGERLDFPDFTIPAASYQEVDLRTLLANYLPQMEEGSLQVSHQGIRLQLGAQFKILKQGMLFDEQFITPAARFPSSRMESVWWLPSTQCDTKFIVSNTTGAPVTAIVRVDGTAPQQTQPATIQLNPHQTRVLDVLKDLVNQPNGGTVLKEGGISLTHSGGAGAIIARMLVSKESTGYSSIVNFTDPTAPRSSRLHGGGLRLGSIGGDELEPIVIARNVGDEPTTISGRVPYTNESGAVVFVTIPAVNIPVGEIKTINVEQALKQANVPPSVTFAGIELEYSTAPGSVVMTVQSVSRSGQQVFQVPLLDPQKMPSSAGGFPWKVGGDYTTVIFIKNETATTKKYFARLIYEGGVYATKVREVKPSQTVALDFKQMRDEQTPDSMGNKIPLTIERGQIAWSMVGTDNNTMSGRSEQVNTVRGVSSTYACYNCCPDTFRNSYASPNSYQFGIGDQGQYGFQVEVVSCNQFPSSAQFDGYNWFSSNQSVGTIGYYGMATAMGGGTANMTGYFDEVTWTYITPTATCSSQTVTNSGTGEMVVKPKIDNITPDRSVINRIASVTIDGKGFAAGATVQVTGGTVVVSDVVVVSATKITAKFTIPPNATQSKRQVSVTVSGQTSNSKEFLFQVPNKLEVIADTGNLAIPNCPTIVRRQVTYKLIDQDDKEIREAVEIIEDLSGVSTNSCGNGVPAAPSCAVTDPPPQQGQPYRFTDSISVSFNCADTTAQQNCQSNPSCGYTYTQKWKTCGGDGNIQLFSVSGSTLCNQIRLNNSTQFSIGTRPPN